MELKHLYIPLVKSYSSYKGISERLIRYRLIKEGYEVWRSSALSMIREPDVYPNVKRKYKRLQKILKDYEYFTYLDHVHHGMPDFICFRDSFLFVECKLGHEQLSTRQKRCIEKLREKGYRVEVHKIVFPETKIRKAWVDIFSNKKRIIEKQQKLNHFNKY